jgi:ABC-type Fe3+ transport system permease subunit
MNEEKTENPSTASAKDPAHDHHRAIHGFGLAAHWTFVPGICLSILFFILWMVFVFLISQGNASDWKDSVLKLLQAFRNIFSYAFYVALQAMICGIVFHCLMRHFKADDPDWKDRLNNDGEF